MWESKVAVTSRGDLEQESLYVSHARSHRNHPLDANRSRTQFF